MEYSNILVDTSIIIEYLRKTDKADTQLHVFMKNYQLYTSSIVEFELRAGALNALKQQQVEKILSAFIILPFTSQVSQEAAFIYQKLKQDNKLLEIRDIFIAATAISHVMPLTTLNRKHFERIDRLHVL